MKLEPIAIIHTPFKEKFGIPRQSGRIDLAIGTIEFIGEFANPDYIRGIEEYSHLWLLFDFSKSHRDEHSPTVRPPRLGGNTRIGVFATRSPFRPNSIGLSCVKFIGIENGMLKVAGIDLLDNTPIYDIKPYIPYTDSQPNATSSFAGEHNTHRLEVALSIKNTLATDDELRLICACIADDPRPSYQNDEREYTLRINSIDTTFVVENNIAKIIGFKKIEE